MTQAGEEIKASFAAKEDGFGRINCNRRVTPER